MSWKHLVWAAAAALLLPACVLDRTGFSPGEDGAGGAGAGKSDGGAGATGGAATTGSGGSGASSSSGAMGGSGGTPTPMCPTGFECVPAIATGRFVRMPTSTDTCGGDWAIEAAYAAPNDPGCNMCSCGAAAGGDCSIHAESFNAFDCTQQVGNENVTGTECLNLGGFRSAFIVDPPTPQGGACPPMGGGPIAVTTTTACGTAEATDMPCGTGMVCVPEGGGELCNVVGDADSCSTGYQDMMGPVATVEGDTRQCTCACDAPATPTCSGAGGTVHSLNGCASPLDSVPATSSCTDTINSNGSFFVDAGTWSAGVCTPSTNVGGSVMFGVNERLCCLAGN